MALVKTKYGRRSFLKSSALAGGGLMLGFSWLASCNPSIKEISKMPDEWFKINGFLKIGNNGIVTIMSPNPEGGQNVKTSMPMIVAEELDIDWGNVIVEQARLDTEVFTRQAIGGSQAIRRGWQGLRMAGASARQMLREAVSKEWNVPIDEITTKKGVLYHSKTDRSVGYGEMASAASKIPVPEEVSLKPVEDFNIIGSSRKNVDGLKIITGQPLFGFDTKKEEMLTAMIVHPPAFGLQVKSFDSSTVSQMPGIKDVFPIKVLNEDYEKEFFDTCAFPDLIAIVGNSTWEVMNAKKALILEYESISEKVETRHRFGSKVTFRTPSGLESTDSHYKQMAQMAVKSATIRRKDGNPEKAFKNAVKIIERTYTAPFLAHNCMEPMNFFADVNSERALLSGPLQKPEFTEQTLSKRLGMPLEKIDIQMTRLGGGYGRRSYATWLIEAALISQKMNAPVKLIYSREDDMTGGIYRPTYRAIYRAALDAENNLIGFHVNAGGIPESPLFANRFPAGAVANYLAEDWTIDSNITVGSFRAPRSNFIASAEQSFLDEIAEEVGKDPIDFRLELLEKAMANPVGENNDYEADRYAGVLKLVREKSKWGEKKTGIHRGVSAYFCHNSYAAQVVDLSLDGNNPVVQNVYSAVDCGIVVNPDAAANLCEGAILDGIGNALYGAMTFNDGVPEKNNFHNYRMIRMSEAPKNIETFFVKNMIDPTGLGEPAFPPVIGALANALYQATGKRNYDQPFLSEM